MSHQVLLARTQLLYLTQQMAHLISNLQVYFQVDVIEVEYSNMQDSIAAAHDFAEVERAHSIYLSRLLSQTFLENEVVSQSLTDVFHHVKTLCKWVQDDDEGEYATASDPADIAELTKEFLRSANALYTVFKSNKTDAAQRMAPLLRQLLLRLNFNGAYGRQAARAIATGESSHLLVSSMQPPTQSFSTHGASSWMKTDTTGH
ncbi:Gamma-tubulin complex component 4 [Cymbomonas tetramitiformis]|uniref:Gamma-tubulin complex component n=1 Tax=Cymbomonas tetramitiformis TaxID=36881 RepID=A0AAE0BAP9_9CHLO|nr:Gamma-tubulin complex component 4 [Cymbomonas tetramitiformis]